MELHHGRISAWLMEAKLTVSIVSTCRTDVLFSIIPCANGKLSPWVGVDWDDGCTLASFSVSILHPHP